MRALDAVRRSARAQADDVLAYLPDTGDPVTGRAVDDFVEQAADALRALDEVLHGALAQLTPASPADEYAGERADPPVPAESGLAEDSVPSGRRRHRLFPDEELPR